MKPLEFTGVSKTYGPTLALSQVNLALNENEIFGLIGPDGAGKTTAMRLVCTLLKPDEGQISVLGFDSVSQPMAVRQILGYMPQKFSLYQDLSVEQNINFYSRLFGVKAGSGQKDRLYSFSRLGNFRSRKAGALSGGMKQKLALCCCLIHLPKLLVLDEPTFGVDPLSREEFWQMLHQIRADGVSIFVSTPYMDEAGKCDRVALIHKGVIRALDTPAHVTASYPYSLWSLEGDLEALHAWLAKQQETEGLQFFGHCLHVSFKQDPSDEFWQRLTIKHQREKLEPVMEDVFLELMEER